MLERRQGPLAPPLTKALHRVILTHIRPLSGGCGRAAPTQHPCNGSRSLHNYRVCCATRENQYSPL